MRVPQLCTLTCGLTNHCVDKSCVNSVQHKPPASKASNIVLNMHATWCVYVHVWVCGCALFHSIQELTRVGRAGEGLTRVGRADEGLPRVRRAGQEPEELVKSW